MRLDVTPVSGEVEGDTRSVLSTGLVEAGPDTTPTKNRQAWTKQKTEHPIVRYNEIKHLSNSLLCLGILSDQPLLLL